MTKDIFKTMSKTGLHCPKCGLWLPRAEVKKGIKCPECGTFCKVNHQKGKDKIMRNDPLYSYRIMAIVLKQNNIQDQLKILKAAKKVRDKNEK